MPGEIVVAELRHEARPAERCEARPREPPPPLPGDGPRPPEEFPPPPPPEYDDAAEEGAAAVLPVIHVGTRTLDVCERSIGVVEVDILFFCGRSRVDFRERERVWCFNIRNRCAHSVSKMLLVATNAIRPHSSVALSQFSLFARSYDETGESRM